MFGLNTYIGNHYIRKARYKRKFMLRLHYTIIESVKEFQVRKTSYNLAICIILSSMGAQCSELSVNNIAHWVSWEIGCTNG